jgi:hypothetical protein
MANKPTHAAGNYCIEIDGFMAGWVNSVEVPSYEIDKVETKTGAFVETRKAGGNVKIGTFGSTYSISETNKILDWCLSLPRKQVVTTAGAVIMSNHNFDAMRRIDWTEGYITELKFPALAANEAKKPFTVDFKWQPSTVEYTKASGKISATQGAKHKTWLTSNFRFQGLPGDVDYITKIDLPAITAKLAAESYGTKRLPEQHYANIDIGEVKLEFSARSRDSVLGYVQKVIRDGKLTDNEYLDFGIELLDPSLAKTMGTIQLYGCGLLKYTEPKYESNKEETSKFTLDFTVERFDLKMNETTG